MVKGKGEQPMTQERQVACSDGWTDGQMVGWLDGWSGWLDSYRHDVNKAMADRRDNTTEACFPLQSLTGQPRNNTYPAVVVPYGSGGALG